MKLSLLQRNIRQIYCLTHSTISQTHCWADRYMLFLHQEKNVLPLLNWHQQNLGFYPISLCLACYIADHKQNHVSYLRHLFLSIPIYIYSTALARDYSKGWIKKNNHLTWKHYLIISPLCLLKCVSKRSVKVAAYLQIILSTIRLVTALYLYKNQQDQDKMKINLNFSHYFWFIYVSEITVPTTACRN